MRVGSKAGATGETRKNYFNSDIAKWLLFGISIDNEADGHSLYVYFAYLKKYIATSDFPLISHIFRFPEKHGRRLAYTHCVLMEK